MLHINELLIGGRANRDVEVASIAAKRLLIITRSPNVNKDQVH